MNHRHHIHCWLHHTHPPKCFNRKFLIQHLLVSWRTPSLSRSYLLIMNEVHSFVGFTISTTNLVQRRRGSSSRYIDRRHLSKEKKEELGYECVQGCTIAVEKNNGKWLAYSLAGDVKSDVKSPDGMVSSHLVTQYAARIPLCYGAGECWSVPSIRRFYLLSHLLESSMINLHNRLLSRWQGRQSPSVSIRNLIGRTRFEADSKQLVSWTLHAQVVIHILHPADYLPRPYSHLSSLRFHPRGMVPLRFYGYGCTSCVAMFLINVILLPRIVKITHGDPSLLRTSYRRRVLRFFDGYWPSCARACQVPSGCRLPWLAYSWWRLQLFMVILNLQDTGLQRICVPSLCFEVGAMAIMSMLSIRFRLSPQLNFLWWSRYYCP